jgi:hypothetical protein
VDTAHAVLERSQTRNGAYVQLTRGREGNYAYCVTEHEADAHDHQDYALAPSDVLGEVLAHDGSQISAVETYRARLEAGDSLAEMAPLWGLVTRDAMADRHHDILLDQLGADRCDWLTAEQGHERLMGTLQHLELSGHNADWLIRDVLARSDRPLEDAESMSDTLAARIRRGIAEREPEQRPVPGRWQDRAAATPGPIGEYTRELAQLMDERGEMMARAAILAPPEHALVALGPVPDETNESARRGWAERAAALGIYREIRSIPDDEMGLGPAPSREQDPVAHVAWTRAWEALGRPDQDSDHQLASDEQLRERIRQWEREQDWAPLYVGDELQRASTLSVEFHREATHARERFEAELDNHDGAETPDAVAARAEAERAERLAERYDAAEDRYQRLAEARERWAEHTAEQADAAGVAAAELDRRGQALDPASTQPAEGEQLPLLEADDQQQVALPERLDPDRQARELDDGYVLPGEHDAADNTETEQQRDQLPQVPDYYADAVSSEQRQPVTADEATVLTEDYQPPEHELEHTELGTTEADPEKKSDRQRDEAQVDAAPAQAAAELEPQDENQSEHAEPRTGDYGSGYTLDEVTETDAQYPEPEPVDPDQHTLFDLDPTPADRVEAGHVRSDSDLSVKAADDRARLAEETIAARELRAERKAEQDAQVEAERQRAERERADQERAEPQAQREPEATTEHTRADAARRVEHGAGRSEPELGR